jgi:hypothetical protein
MSDGQPPRPDERLDNLTSLVALKVLPALRSQDIRTSAISTLLWVALGASVVSATLSAATLWAVLDGS